jgi:rsbT antagonist protein RsbS
MQVSRGVVVASIQRDLDEATLARFREDLLHRVHATGLAGVIFDISALETLDSEEFAGLRGVMAMCRLMGAEPVLAGMRPGVVSALIETGVDIAGLQAAIDLDAAFERLLPRPGPEIPRPAAGTADADEDSSDDRAPTDRGTPPVTGP